MLFLIFLVFVFWNLNLSARIKRCQESLKELQNQISKAKPSQLPVASSVALPEEAVRGPIQTTVEPKFEINTAITSVHSFPA